MDGNSGDDGRDEVIGMRRVELGRCVYCLVSG